MSKAIRSKSFFQKSALDLAKSLLGCELHIRHVKKWLSGMIVETESYHQDDPASHSFGGPKNRNQIMFDSGGHVYVYFIYGNYFCFNIVAGKKGTGEAVLIRALEPISGIPEMISNRGKSKILDLCSGPGKLCSALQITKKQNGIFLPDSEDILLTRLKKIKPKDIVASPRIGITKGVEHLHRFTVRDSEFISTKKGIINKKA